LSRSERKLNYRILKACCDAVSLLRLRDGMGKGLAPVVGALKCVRGYNWSCQEILTFGPAEFLNGCSKP
jgi:hypothetical protein